MALHAVIAGRMEKYAYDANEHKGRYCLLTRDIFKLLASKNYKVLEESFNQRNPSGQNFFIDDPYPDDHSLTERRKIVIRARKQPTDEAWEHADLFHFNFMFRQRAFESGKSNGYLERMGGLVINPRQPWRGLEEH